MHTMNIYQKNINKSIRLPLLHHRNIVMGSGHVKASFTETVLYIKDPQRKCLHKINLINCINNFFISIIF
jgi:hypothetical protein